MNKSETMPRPLTTKVECRERNMREIFHLLVASWISTSCYTVANDSSNSDRECSNGCDKIRAIYRRYFPLWGIWRYTVSMDDMLIRWTDASTREPKTFLIERGDMFFNTSLQR